MKKSKQSLNSEIRDLRGGGEQNAACLNFQKVLSKQQEVIHSLQAEILLLKSYISLQKTAAAEPVHLPPPPVTLPANSPSSTKKSSQQEGGELALQNCHKILRQLADILEIKDTNIFQGSALVESLEKLKEAYNKNKEPIFVERIKEIKVPITVEKIVEMTVEKIVYRDLAENNDKKTEKMEKTPAFKEKTEKYGRRQEDNQQTDHTLNKTYSEKNIRRKPEESYREDKYNQTRYEPYKKTETGGNPLIKKRSEAPRYSGYRKNYD